MPAEPPISGPRMSVGLMVMGSEMAGFAVIGLLIDLAAGTMPGFTIGLTLFGFAVVFYHLMRLSKQMTRRNGKSP